MQEIWKDIIGYEGLYQVSNLGRIKSLERKYESGKYGKDIIKKFTKLPNGYLKVGLSRNGKKKYYFVHRLVAQMFITNFKNKPTVDHIDRNRTNNVISNLRWATYKEQRKNRC